MTSKFLKTMGTAAIAVLISSASVFAGSITDRIAAGDPIRIGFSNVPIWGYPDEDGKAKGFVNEIALGILNEMGYSEVETTVTDWGGLIPGLKANRYDIITGGLYILNSRCENISFSEPIATAGDGFMVPTGNPKNLNTYEDIVAAGATLVTGAGYNTVEVAKKQGMKDENIMQVPGPTEMLAAIKAGRADVAGLTFFEASHLAKNSGGAAEVTDPAVLPEWNNNWVGVGFRGEDADFLAKFNEALSKYVGTDAMLASVAEYGYTPGNLPGDKTAEWACQNR